MEQPAARVAWVGLLMILGTLTLSAQGRDYIRDAIKEWGECKTVAITDRGGDVAVYGSNGYATAGALPPALIRNLKELHGADETFTDITLTEEGSWLILYGLNGIAYEGIPKSLEREMRTYHDRGDRITSIALNDEGDWIIISKEYYTSSDEEIQSFIADGAEKYGLLYAAHLSDDGLVVVYENGYKFLGNVPSDLIEILTSEPKNVYRVKFTPKGHFFISDRKGWYRYKM